MQRNNPNRNQNLNGSRLTCALYIVIVLWFGVTIVALAYIFKSETKLNVPAVSDSKDMQRDLQSQNTVDPPKANPFNIVDASVTDKPETLKPSLKIQDEPPKHLNSHIEDMTRPIRHSESKSAIKRITRDELRQKIWQLNAQEQREALQNLHDLEPPSDKAANEFIQSAKQSVIEGVKPGDPPIWENPGSGEGKPGDMVNYKIAGVNVKIPYGYPEETIFILTASYKDPEVASTMARAFARAAHPDRIFIGVHAQNEGGEAEPERDPIAGLPYTGLKCPQHPICSRIDHVKVSRQHYSLSEGPTVARARAESFYNNETYVLGIDSHCQFKRGWDNIAIDMFKRINNDYAIISTYPISYSEDHQGGDGSDTYDPPDMPPYVTAICQTRRVNLHTTISFKHNFNQLAAPKNGPVRVAFFAAGFSFSRGHRILRVPYDFYTPYLFDGEEISMGVRAWTWGYDLYQPDRTIIGHLYISSGSSLRPVFWDSPDWGIQWPCQYSSLLRLQKELHIFDVLQKPKEPGSLGPGGIQREDKLDMTDFKKYEVGPRRDADEFWRWAKIDLQNNWGAECTESRLNPNDTTPLKKGRQYCYSTELCSQYAIGDGMPYVPWKPGTENL